MAKAKKTKEDVLKELFDACRGYVDDASTDLDKFISGNNAAGGRARKSLQEVKKLVKLIRDQVTEIKNGRKETK